MGLHRRNELNWVERTHVDRMKAMKEEGIRRNEANRVGKTNHMQTDRMKTKKEKDDMKEKLGLIGLIMSR